MNMAIKSVDEIISQLNRFYPVKQNLYEVQILGGDPSTDASPEIMINCSNINIPGSNIQHTPNRRYALGPEYKTPVGRSYTELNMTFYESENEKEREYFINWQDKIYNKQTKRFSFYNDYIKNVIIRQYTRSGKKSYEARLTEAFPSNISPLDRGYANEGLAQFNVIFQFYEIEETFYDKEATSFLGIL